jgi:hypothetical protein
MKWTKEQIRQLKEPGYRIKDLSTISGYLPYTISRVAQRLGYIARFYTLDQAERILNGVRRPGNPNFRKGKEEGVKP